MSDPAIRNASDLRDTMATPGWLVVEAVLEGFRREAFEEWSQLELDAKPEKVIALKAREKVAREIRLRIQEVVKYGDEAREVAAAAEKAEADAERFDLAQVTTDEEVRGLMDPKISAEAGRQP